jgi:hypothetical protein
LTHPAAPRVVSSPLTEAMLAPLDARSRSVQFKTALRDEDYERLGRFMADYPDVLLYVYGRDPALRDLHFLRYFPTVRRFATRLFELETLDGLAYLSPDLEYLSIGSTRSRKFSMGPLARFSRLEELYLERQSKDLHTIGRLKNLRRLTLQSITLPDLSILTPLERLWSLDIKLGGTKDLTLLPSIGRLKYLELWMIRAIEDVSPISELSSLQDLLLQALRRVERLPSMAGLTNLRRVHLHTMKGLRDLSPLTQAPALEELLVWDMNHLQVDDFRCLVGHPTLKAVGVAFASARKASEVENLLGLPGSPNYRFDQFRFL